MTDRSTGPRCGNNPNTRLTPGDRKAVDDFKARLALQAATKPYIERAAWVDFDPLMEVIAATVWEHCGRDSEDMPQLVCDDPRTIAAFAAAVARAHAAAVPAAAADQAALREQLAAVVRSITTVGGAPPRLIVPVIDGSNPRMARIADWQPLDGFLDAVLAVLPAPAEQIAEVCICRHAEPQHFEDACLVCNCGDYLVPEAAREVIARWRTAALQARADRAAVLTAAERAMLTYALDQAQERIWSEDGFTEEDQAAVTSLRRMADETQQPETRQSCACGQDGCEYCDVDVADEEQPAATCTNCRGTGLDPRYSTGEYDCPDCPPANEPAAVQQPKEA